MQLRIDPAVAQILPGAVPADWATRAIFIHSDVSNIWVRRAAAEPDALEARADILSLYTSVIGGLDCGRRSFISLGAGGGLVDKTIIARIDRLSCYVPIDLSPGMCRWAYENVKQFCSVPFGVVGDFESGFEHIRKALKPLSKSRKFLCAASAIGNLDLGEANFLQNLLEVMEKGDYLLLSMSTGLFGPIDRETFDAKVGWRDLSGLLSCGISMITGEDVCSANSSLEQRLDAREGMSDIPGTESIAVWDRACRRTLLYLRRYNLSNTLSWLERRFPLKVVRSSELLLAPKVGVAAIVLER